jgi:hypothetical protein
MRGAEWEEEEQRRGGLTQRTISVLSGLVGEDQSPTAARLHAADVDSVDEPEDPPEAGAAEQELARWSRLGEWCRDREGVH